MIRDNWYVGKQYKDDTNTFSEVTKLCKQGFVAGYTDRNGEVILNSFLQAPIKGQLGRAIEGSLKNFKLSPLSKCYNDFTIRYDYRCGQYQKEYGIHKVDEDAFPEYYQLDDGLVYDIKFNEDYDIRGSSVMDGMPYLRIHSTAGAMVKFFEDKKAVKGSFMWFREMHEQDGKTIYSNGWNTVVSKIIHNSSYVDVYFDQGEFGIETEIYGVGDNIAYGDVVPKEKITFKNVLNSSENTDKNSLIPILDVSNDNYLKPMFSPRGVVVGNKIVWDYTDSTEALDWLNSFKNNVKPTTYVLVNKLIRNFEGFSFEGNTITHTYDEELVNKDLDYYLPATDETELEMKYWQDYVVGVDDYVTAKDLWELAHDSYVINNNIRKVTSDRGDLEFAINTSVFYLNEGIDSKYAFDYFNMFVRWSTMQKLSVDLSLPITIDNIKIEMLDKVFFYDEIITPLADDKALGWITSVGLDTKRDLVKLKLTFDPKFLIPRSSIVEECTDIIEDINNVEDILEDVLNTEDIIEGQC